ncbi:MAG: hypothetical protein AMDU5_GPLC00017G0041 [Thermoplasmatales archaeon Gpl]|nr:MAG: hypothetical protein AMDU5_GPLC00017G0041 [Thermoplasmatales archaeon Gpl]
MVSFLRVLSWSWMNFIDCETMAVHRQSFSNLDSGPADFEKYLVMSGSLIVHGSGIHAQALLKLRNVLRALKLS